MVDVTGDCNGSSTSDSSESESSGMGSCIEELGACEVLGAVLMIGVIEEIGRKIASFSIRVLSDIIYSSISSSVRDTVSSNGLNTPFISKLEGCPLLTGGAVFLSTRTLNHSSTFFVSRL